MVTEMFWTGVLFGTCMTLLLLWGGIALYLWRFGSFMVQYNGSAREPLAKGSTKEVDM